VTLTVRLNPELENRIDAIAKQQGLTKSQWVRQLIEQKLKEELALHPMTPYQMAEELGLVGCIEGGPEDLAANAKKYITEKLRAKRSR
jgi:Predicted DNA-binding protein with an HTH domain